MQSIVILSTKIVRPRLRKDIVHRERLTRTLTLEELKGVKLLLVSAPAGFGKTTLVLEWLSRLKCGAAWLSLDEFDNNIRQFLTSLVASLQLLNPALGKQLLPILRGATTPHPEQLIAMLVNDFQLSREEIVIVLDDYHRIDDREVHSALSLLLDHLPAQVHVAITTRVDPMLPLARLRVQNQLAEVRQRDLRFTSEEAGQFLSDTMGCRLSAADVRMLEERTEGWIAGLQIAAVSLRSAVDSHQFIASFTGSHRYVVDYLLDEVFLRQPETLQRFLVETCILGQLNAELCDAVTGRQDAASMIGVLERANVFLFPLDHRRVWYRYHQLFAEMLQIRLQQLSPDQRDQLHLRASRWYEEHHEPNLAIEHALAMTCFDRALELLDGHALDYFQRSELALVEKFISRVPPELHTSYPRLLMAKAWVQLMTHHAEMLQETLSRVTAALRHPPGSYTPRDIGAVRAHLLSVRAFTLRLLGEYDESIAVSKRALSSLPPDECYVRSILLLNMGRVWMKRGFPHKAIESFERCLAVSDRTENYYVTLGAHAHLGIQHAVIKPLDVAQKMLEVSLARAERDGLDQLPACGFIMYQLGRVLYQRNELDRARTILERAVTLGENGNEPDVLFNALRMKALVCWAAGDRKTARQTMQRALEIISRGAIQVYEADAPHAKGFLSMLDDDQQGLQTWIEHEHDLMQREFSTVTEFECTSLMLVLLRLRKFREVLPYARWLRLEAERRGRTSSIGHADLYEGLALYGLGQEDCARSFIDRALDFGARYGWVREFLSNGLLMREALQWYCSAKSKPSTARAFGALLLRSFDGGAPVVIPQFRQGVMDRLTGREQEVLHYLCRGMPNKDIARSMFISSNTLKTHIRRLFAKLGAANRSEALLKAREAGLLAQQELR